MTTVHRISVSREDNDQIDIQGDTFDVLRASIGGNDGIGYYLVFRGEPDQIVTMLEMITAAAKDMLPRGAYNDKRRE